MDDKTKKQMAKMVDALQPHCDEQIVAAMTCSHAGSMRSLLISRLLGGGQILIPDGPAIVEGERYGRLVHIETIDKYSLTVLQAKLPEFTVLSKEGKLTPSEKAPGEVVDTLKSLRKAKRWQGIDVYASPDGIAIQRESRGTNMWLYDLWLAEYLLDKISTSQT